MHKQLFLITILTVLSIFTSSCAPSQSAIRDQCTPDINRIAHDDSLSNDSTYKYTRANTNLDGNTRCFCRNPRSRRSADYSGRYRRCSGWRCCPDRARHLYLENLTISQKSITLASHFLTTGDEQFITNTVIDGNKLSVIKVTKTAGPDTRIIGLTIQNGDNGISARSNAPNPE